MHRDVFSVLHTKIVCLKSEFASTMATKQKAKEKQNRAFA